MKRKLLIAATVVVAAVTVVAACSTSEDGKYTTSNNDVPTINGNRNAAEIGWMPDGYSNYATKCDRPGVRVYVLFHSDGAYGNVSAIADPNCK